MKKTDKLTSEQISHFASWVQKWVDISLSTEPADFEVAITAALRGYAFAGLEKPRVILRMGSPYAATIGGAIACLMLSRQQVEQQVGQQIRQQIRQPVEQQVEQQVGQQVRQQVGQQVRQQVWQQVEQQIRQQVEQQVWQQVGQGVYNYGVSSLWTSWGAYITFLRDVCGWFDPVLKQFEIYEVLMKSCGWTWWHKDIFVISDRPKEINLDTNGRLHCENGPSIAYRDGWSLYHWHGVVIPPEWVTGNKPTAKEALTWKNIEQRRAAAEIVGWHNVLNELNAKIIDSDPEAQVGTLLEADIPDSGKERFLKVKCGTGREFVLPVPREVKTALAASAWTYGLDNDIKNYIPEVRT